MQQTDHGGQQMTDSNGTDDDLELDVEHIDMTDAMGAADDMKTHQAGPNSPSPSQQPDDAESDETASTIATDEPDQPQQEELTETVTDPSEIDWSDLWDEFGFRTEDCVGSIKQSQTKLVGALEASDQNIAGTPRDHIRWAVENDVLTERYTSCDTLAGYILSEMLQ